MFSVRCVFHRVDERFSRGWRWRHVRRCATDMRVVFEALWHDTVLHEVVCFASFLFCQLCVIELFRCHCLCFCFLDRSNCSCCCKPYAHSTETSHDSTLNITARWFLIYVCFLWRNHVLLNTDRVWAPLLVVTAGSLPNMGFPCQKQAYRTPLPRKRRHSCQVFFAAYF